uniref:Putative ATPase domain containing protein n=2 Tax=viral metagenome TaxID=1070528 RepID=A0A6M3J5A4_9ZZZZ
MLTPTKNTTLYTILIQRSTIRYNPIQSYAKARATMADEIYSKVSSKLEAEWYPYHENEWFTHTDICGHFQWFDPKIRSAVSRKLYHDYKEISEPKLEKNNKAYRIVDKTLDEIEWENADIDDVYKLKMPYDPTTNVGFPFESLICIPPGALIIIAGASNAGKTTWLLNMLVRNMDDFEDVVYFTSELSAVNLKRRLNPFEEWYELRNGDGKPKFKVFDRESNYHDAIYPKYSNGLVFIDYLDVNNEAEYFKMKPYLKRIKRSMRRGVAVVALQKNPGVDDAFGGKNLRSDADLYIAMDFGQIKIIKAKDWHTENPNLKKYKFDIEFNGSTFTNIQGIYEE